MARKRRLYTTIYDTGHGYGEFNYYSEYRNNSANNRHSAYVEMKLKFGASSKDYIIIETYRTTTY